MIPALPIGTDVHQVNRRKFLGGAWRQQQSASESSSSEIAQRVTILVHARPDRLTAVERAVAALDGLAVMNRDPVGRLLISRDADGAEDIGTTLTAIMEIRGVLNAALAAPGMQGAIHT